MYKHSFIMCCICSSCAINDMGLAKMEVYQNKTAYVVMLETWGGALRTIPLDFGFTLGHTRRYYVFDNNTENDNVSLRNNLAKNVGLTPKGSHEALHDEYSMKPLSRVPLVIGRTEKGLSVDANTTRFGMRLGLTSGYSIHLPSSFRGIIMLHQDSEHPENSRVRIVKGEAL